MSLDLSQDVSDLFEDLGDKGYVKLNRTVGAVSDPIAGTVTGDTNSDVDVLGMVVDVSSSLVDGSRIKVTDKMVLLDNQVAPLYTDLVKFGGISYTVVQINERNHAGIVQLYEVVCRG